jgi:hypothetical protein
VFLVDVDGADDPELTNALDVGMQTSIRLTPAWVVRVAEGTQPPTPPAGHNFCVLAELRRPRGVQVIEQSMIKDMRQKRLTMSDLTRRIELIERVLLRPAFATTPFSPPRQMVGQVITINGTNLTVGGSATTVLFGDKPAEVVGTPSPTQLQTRVPTDLVPTGTAFVDVKITVRTAGGAAISDDAFRAARVVPATKWHQLRVAELEDQIRRSHDRFARPRHPDGHPDRRDGADRPRTTWADEGRPHNGDNTRRQRH